MRAPVRKGTNRYLRKSGFGAIIDAMQRFAFRAVDLAGTQHAGVREALSRESIAAELRTDGFFVLEIRESKKADHAAASRLPWSRRTDLVDATRTISTLLTAGLALPRALDAAAKLSRDPVASALAALRGRVERGDRLAIALGSFPGIFPRHYVGLVRAGERSGELAVAFKHLSDQLEREAQLRSRLLSAFLYPLILALAGGGAMLVLVLVVLPNFAELLVDSGATLPGSTAFVLSASGIVREWWFLVPLPVLLAGVSWPLVRQNPSASQLAARVVDGIPLVGPLVRESAAARFARLTGTMLSGGAPLLDALDDAAGSLDAPLSRAAAHRVRVAVREGQSLHRAILRETAFPPLLAQLAAVGEESARLDEHLLKAAQLFEERTDRVAQRLVTLAEPLLIVAFGGVIGFVALALLQAIYGVETGSFR